LWLQWGDEVRPWPGLQLPISEEDTTLFNAASIVMLGNGRRARFWTSRWLNGVSLAA
jgi:hypothetical protein